MDMKKILQAIDTVASLKPADSSNDMKKFVQIVNESATPHKVSLPVQMAMNHYQEPKVKKESVLRKYFKEAEEVVNQQQIEKRQHLQMYAQTIAKRVLEQGIVEKKQKGLAEGSLEEYGDTAKGQKMLTKVQKRAVDRVVSKKADTDPKYAKKNSDTANRAWDRMTDKDLEEGLKDPKDNPCWKGYKPVGTKKKGGRTVPNCVPTGKK